MTTSQGDLDPDTPLTTPLIIPDRIINETQSPIEERTADLSRETPDYNEQFPFRLRFRDCLVIPNVQTLHDSRFWIEEQSFGRSD